MIRPIIQPDPLSFHPPGSFRNLTTIYMKLILTAIFALSLSMGKAQDTPGSARTSLHDTIPATDREQAEYPGGKTAWNKFLGKNLHYPDDAVNNVIQGDIVVQFQVNDQGDVSDVHAISGPTRGGLRQEAVRIISISGKWEPAIKNGVKVNSVNKRTISFKILVG